MQSSIAHVLIFRLWKMYINNPQDQLSTKQEFAFSIFLPVCLPLLPWVTSTRSLCQTPILKKPKMTIRRTPQHESGQSYYICKWHGVEPDILSIPGSVFPPMRSAFFPQETWCQIIIKHERIEIGLHWIIVWI